MFASNPVLIIEAEVLIALDIQRILTDRGANEAIFARSSADASAMTLPDNLAVAIIEALPSDPQWCALMKRVRTDHIPCILTTAEAGLRGGVPGYEGIPVLPKPFMERDLLAALSSAMQL